MTLPTDAYSSAAIRQLERDAMATGVAGYTLMQRAGAAALAVVRRRWPGARRVAIVAGTGNNGGDGLVLARLAAAAGFDVRVMLVGDAASMRGEAAEALRDLRAAGLGLQPFAVDLLHGCDVVVDALLGIGVRAPMRPDWLVAIQAMNAGGVKVFSLDLPSGLEPDTGRSLPAVKAAATLTFLGLKQGMFLGAGPEHTGAIDVDALGVSVPAVMPALKLLDARCLQRALPPRPRQAHKGLFGRVLIIGGGPGMPGAVRMAGESALRVGAGLVTVASRPEHLHVVVGARPELMFLAAATGADLSGALEQADVIAIGPGLGRSDWAQKLLQCVLHHSRPGQRLVLDADALNLVAQGGALHRENWILTPHPGEAAGLLGRSAEAVQEDRMAALDTLVRSRGGIVVLKGASTLVGHAGEVPRLCTRGNPGMAVPGMGDVLTGAIAGLLAQGAAPFVATCAAVEAHARAGDSCAAGGMRGVLALDVAAQLRAELVRAELAPLS